MDSPVIAPEPDHKIVIELDSMTRMMLRHLEEHQAQEPEVPTGDDDRYAHEEKAALHYEWSRAHQAIRLMLGIQLVNLAVDQITPKKGTE